MSLTPISPFYALRRATMLLKFPADIVYFVRRNADTNGRSFSSEVLRVLSIHYGLPVYRDKADMQLPTEVVINLSNHLDVPLPFDAPSLVKEINCDN